MDNIAEIPYYQVRFDKHGAPAATNQLPSKLPQGTTDVFVISHGWRNDEQDAETIYRDFFGRLKDSKIVDQQCLDGRNCVIAGILWPSRNFDALIAAQAPGKHGNAAAVGEAKSDADSQARLKQQIEELKRFEDLDPGALAALTLAQELIPQLDDKTTAREDFLRNLRSLMDPSFAGKDDASDIFLKLDANSLFERLNLPPQVVDPSLPKSATASISLADTRTVGDGRAAGLLDVFKGAAASASNAVSYLSYYLMKERAGLVGQKGVGPFINALAAQGARIHLIGHSFGGRVVTAAAMASATDKIASMTLLQAAFSHNGFSPAEEMNGFFRKVVEEKRVQGPILITHTKNDTAVGIAYPLASRLSRNATAALGDENDKYGGIGRNGAQRMRDGEVIKGRLLPLGSTYQFTPGAIHNLLADQITNHGDITREEVVAAFGQALGPFAQ